VGHVALTTAKRNLDNFLVGKTEGETLLRRYSPSCEVNIKTDKMTRLFGLN
jgi:hypothetical protein